MTNSSPKPPCIDPDLPVSEVLPELCQALDRDRRAVLEAPPGAGKTTCVPLALLSRPWLDKKKIIMLEPRRLACRACAMHMAGMLGEKPGQTIGFQVRNERCIGPDTRIEIVTEGILTRRIQSDPSLKNTGIVIFDEFHERHIHSDLGLALCLEISEVFNQELRILIMSATMDLAALSVLMDNAPMISSQGRTHPVATHYLPMPPLSTARQNYQGGPRSRFREIMAACTAAVNKALISDEGDILLFLPGAAQIREMYRILTDRLEKDGDSNVSILPLFGNLSPKEQALAIAPSLPGRRKIVLATSIAETSLTIQGVRVVVDSGLMRVSRFSPGTAMDRLETIPVSRASADQRRGRAGRTEPGICYRLWSEHLNKGLIPFNRPEILSADLSALTLELALWGVSNPRDLKWLDLPPDRSFDQAQALLKQLKALNGQGRITNHGRRLIEAGIHPRLSHMILKADRMGQGILACRLAALLEERDFLFFKGDTYDPDICLRLEILETLIKGNLRQAKNLAPYRTEFHQNMARTILRNAQKLAQRLKVGSTGTDIWEAGRILALAWPDRIAKKRNNKDQSYLMASGSGAYFPFANTLGSHTYIVAVHLDGNPKNAAIFLGAPLDEKELKQDFKADIKTREHVVWDARTRSVKAFSRTCLSKITIKEKSLVKPDPQAVWAALIQGIKQESLTLLPWNKKLRQFQHRVIFLKNQGRDFHALSDLSDNHLTKTLEHWLAPFLTQVHSAAGLKHVDLTAALKSLLTWEQQQMVETHAPTHVTVPSGSRIPLQYMDEKGLMEFPILAVRLQEMFGLARTPTIARGRIPVTLHLLSPAGRPVQITRDLESFWKNTYHEIKKELMGRYPKHYWPDNPMEAIPTNRAKRRGHKPR